MRNILSIRKSALLSFFIIVIFALSACSKMCEICAGSGMVACDNCSDGKIVCSECDGKGRFDCEKCDGSGKIKTDKECPKCEDSKRKGYNYDTAQALKDLWYGVKRDQEEYWSKCFQCDGTGYVLEECLDCNGTGQGEECENCSATGKITCPKCSGTKETVCTVCEGTGKIKK